jgi:predicted RNase H-like HicB family nuclease
VLNPAVRSADDVSMAGGSVDVSAGSRYGILTRLPVRRSFSAVVTFRDGWWEGDVRDLPGITVHTSDVDSAEAVLREAVGLALGADPGSFDLAVSVVHRERRHVEPELAGAC